MNMLLSIIRCTAWVHLIIHLFSFFSSMLCDWLLKASCHTLLFEVWEWTDRAGMLSLRGAVIVELSTSKVHVSCYAVLSFFFFFVFLIYMCLSQAGSWSSIVSDCCDSVEAWKHKRLHIHYNMHKQRYSIWKISTKLWYFSPVWAVLSCERAEAFALIIWIYMKLTQGHPQQ